MRDVLAVCLVLAAAGCGSSAPSGSDGDAATDDGADTAADDDGLPVDAGADGSGVDASPPDAGFDPSAGVEWFTWPEQQTLGQASWGSDLVDVGRHLPAEYGDTYWFDEPVTASHETSHGIHAHLRNYEAPSSIGWNALYVLGDRAAFIEEPDFRKRDIATRVPAALRGHRYQLYLVEQTAWDDTPLYIYDEWNAYINGAEVGVQQVQEGLWTGTWQDAVMGPLEFTVYALATVQAAKDLDPDYYATNVQFLRFTAWNIERAMGLYEIGRTLEEFEWDEQDAYAETLRTDPSAEPLRQLARDTWTPAWTERVLGF